MKNEARIGIIGGSGFYHLLGNSKEIKVDTPYGSPSDQVMIGEYMGKPLAFIPRHGKTHCFPPHNVPYKANIWALKEMGVKQIIGISACGSLQPHLKPGDFVICDSFVDRTKKRDDTFFNGPEVSHMHCGDVYCENLRDIAITGCHHLNYAHHQKGTMVVIEGPRFSSRSESQFYTRQGWDVVGMTQYPENILAAELGLCYMTIAMVTDYDIGLEGTSDIKSSLPNEIMQTFKNNNERVKALIFHMIEKMAVNPTCTCSRKPAAAKF